MREVGDLLTTAKRVVVKVGTSVLTELGSDQLSESRVKTIAAQIADVRQARRQVILVTSGAIAAGMNILGYRTRPKDLPHLQAASAIGQGRLIHLYDKAVGEHGFHAAQLLLTEEDLRDRRRYLNAKATLDTLLEAGVIPIVNENDTVSVDEIRVGDNDRLAARVAALAGAQLLVLLSDVEGFCKNPEDPAEAVVVIPEIEEVTPELERLARGSRKATSTGGMQTKLLAAKIAMASGITVVLANGNDPQVLTDIVLKGINPGTLFYPHGVPLKGHRRWLAIDAHPKGTIVVDEGARDAIVHRGKSLLASGIQRLEGDFQAREVVRIEDPRGQEFARGVVNYRSEDLSKILGMKTQQIAHVLGRPAVAEVIHRNKMVILKRRGRP